MTVWEYIILFLSVMIGGMLAFWVKKNNPNVLRQILSFSGAYILGITVLHLMPGVFAGGEHEVGLWVMLGFFIQLFLEQLSGGVEHGHIHAPHNPNNSFALAVMTGLSIHAFIEGSALAHFGGFHEHHFGHDHSGYQLFIGVILHKAPAAFALVLLFLIADYPKRKIWMYLILFAAMSPLGAILATFLPANFELQKIIIAIVVGSFLHISTTILFEADSTHHHHISWKKMGIIALGMGFALLTVF